LTLARDGRVLLWERTAALIHVYAPDGTVLSTLRIQRAGSQSQYNDDLRVDSAGRISIYQLASQRRPRPEMLWIRYNPDGTLLDTLRPPPFPRQQEWLSAPDPPVFTSVPFAGMQIAALSPLGYFVTGIGDRYAFELHGDPRGSIVSIRRDVRPLPVTERQRDSARAAATAQMRANAPRWTWNGPDIPRTQPVYHRLIVAEDGRIWVPLIEPIAPRGASSTNQPSMDGPAPRAGLYDVFEATGTYLGQVEIPANVTVGVRRGDHVWGAELGDDDVPRVVRYRIAWK
jgi:hypothetical protein